jgi:hypothetical protein
MSTLVSNEGTDMAEIEWALTIDKGPRIQYSLRRNGLGVSVKVVEPSNHQKLRIDSLILASNILI